MNTTPNRIEIARAYRDRAGLSVCPVTPDGSKKPGPYFLLPIRPDKDGKGGEVKRGWEPLQARRATDDELYTWFGNGKNLGIGIVHGAVSGNSEVLDFDAPGAFEEFAALCADHGLDELLRQAVHVETPSGGRHIYYRHTGEPQGNQKLARYTVPVPAADVERLNEAERKQNGFRHDDKTGGWYKVETKIETRGEGGYTVAPGSPRECHPSGLVYRRLDFGASFSRMPVYSPEDRAALLAMARACNEYTEPERIHRPPTAGQAKERSDADGIKPGDDFNERATAADVWAILEKHGWTLAYTRGDAYYLRRPGKDRYWSATLGYVADNVLYVFTTAAPPFDEEHAYKPFSIFALLECNGDFAEAARQLAAKGYGDQSDKWKPGVRSAKFEAAVEEAKRQREQGEPLDTGNGKPEFRLTELGNAERMLHYEGKDLRYSNALGFLTFDGIRWKRDESGEVTRRMIRTVRTLYSEAAEALSAAQNAPTGEERAKLVGRAKALSSWAHKSEKRSVIAAGIDLAAKLPGVFVETDDLDRPAFLLAVQNGTLDLKTGQLLPHRREDFITKLCAMEYDPDAACPTWETFLARVLPDAAVRDYMRRVVGYTLSGDVSEQALFFLHGDGSNGKSTFLKTLLRLMGDYGQQANGELLMMKEGSHVPNDVAALRGSRFVATIETEEGKRMAESLVKVLTGGDRISARFFRQEWFTFDPTFKIFLAANHKPVIRNTDYAIWRRIKLVPFTEKIKDEEKDPHLPEKLAAELPGILAWAVRGCLEWQESGLQEPDAVKAQTEEYRQESDQIGQFIEECCYKSYNAQARAGDLYQTYCKWSEDRRERPKTQQAFGRTLSERGFERHRGAGNAHIWLGIALLTNRSDCEVTQVTETVKNPYEPGNQIPREALYEKRVETVTTVTTPYPPIDTSDLEDPFAEDDIAGGAA
jgi:P4 family phage/plasmid primase-like protien